MKTWNYRVFRETNGDCIIREVFYAKDGSIVGCTENAVAPSGESLEELAADIESFKDALKFPVLTIADLSVGDINEEWQQEESSNICVPEITAELGMRESSALN